MGLSTVEMPAYAEVALERAEAEAVERTAATSGKVAYEVIRVVGWSQKGLRYQTVIDSRQTWADIAENGVVAGRSYRITTTYQSRNPDGQHTVFVGSDSRDWIEPR